MKRGGRGTVSSNVSACREKNVHAAFAIEGGYTRRSVIGSDAFRD